MIRPREIDAIRDAAGRRTIAELRERATSREEYERLADSYATDNDALRAERADLRSQVEQLQSQVAKLEANCQALLAHVSPKASQTAAVGAPTADDIVPNGETEDVAVGEPTPNEIRFYKKVHSRPTHDVMVRVADCGCNSWEGAHAADKARKGIREA